MQKFVRLLPFLCLFFPLTIAIVATEPLSSSTPSFEIPSPLHSWQFPRDHGAHHTFETEWWYYTGHLWEVGKEPFKDGSDYGFQLTFFRQATEANRSEWSQQYLAHAALSKRRENAFYHESRASRGGLGIAGADTHFLNVWNHQWSAASSSDSHVLEYRLKTPEQTTIRLIASPKTGPIFHGINGVSRKGDCESCTSYYYSYPLLEIRGSLFSNGQETRVTGFAWMDHEIMTSSLEEGKTGWDWFSLQFKDKSSLMLYHVRDKDQSRSKKSGTYVDPHGESFTLEEKDFSITALDSWKSTTSGTTYPSKWRVRVPGKNIDTIINPTMEDQELVFSENTDAPQYWEGAVEGTHVVGFVELAGYDGRLEKKL